MKSKFLLSFLLSLFMIGTLFAQTEEPSEQERKKEALKINKRIDNMRYWLRQAEKGLIPYSPNIKAGDAVFKGSVIKSSLTDYEDSPDITTHEGDDHTQSENSVAVNPNNSEHVFNSNNSTSWSGGTVGSLYGTSGLFSDDAAETWYGSVEGTGGSNSGDPAANIDLNGRIFSGFIHSNSGQGVAYSDDDGLTWTSVQVGNAVGGMLDKNHMTVDNSPISPYSGHVYSAWTDFGSAVSTNDIVITYSSDGGETYSNPVEISSGVNAGSHNQGVNIQTGPNGEVYVVWAIYDDWYGKGYEEAIAMAKSLDGGATWEAPVRIIENLKGIRADEPTGHRVNSFPSMAVDQQTGDIYIVWTNYGVPGVNTGSNASVYMIKSSDQGETWATPVRVNQGEFLDNEAAYLPWMTCDPATGSLSVIFFDTRNVSGNDVETFVAVSLDGGETWEDFRVSDVSFTTQAIPGLAGGYMGDYLGIASLDGQVYPVWSDNRDGIFKSYTSVFSLNLRERPTDLTAVITDEETGETELNWSFTYTPTLDFFNVYRNGEVIGTTTSMTYTETLPDYGEYVYQVSAMHTDGESAKVSASVTWGAPAIEVTPSSLTEELYQNQSSVQYVTISNTGELDLTYNLSTQITSKATREYCSASGGGDEYISGVVMGDINNTGTGEDGYADYTSMSTDVNGGESYDITITNGNSYSIDDIGIWADWNQDNDFDDAGENVVCEPDCGGEGTFTFTVPAEASAGPTTMRIRLKYSGSDCGDPCGTTTWGEVEDYTLNVNNWLNISSNEGLITPGNTEIIDVSFSTYDVDPGNYSANLTITSNDTENPEIQVPVSLIVIGALSASPTANPQTICPGESTQLFANAGGGSGTYTYTWSADVGGFTSSEENPVVTPGQTTTYTVEVNDGTQTLSGSVTVYISETPTIAGTPTGPETVENDTPDVYETSGSDNADSYEWMLTPVEAGSVAGETEIATVTWNTDFTGTAYLSVRGVNNCFDGDYSDELEITVNAGVNVIENYGNTINCMIYPNPSAGRFILEINSELHDRINIEVYNVAGSKVFSNKNRSVWAMNSMMIDLSDLPDGLYFVKVSAENYNAVKKIIKQ